MLGEPSIERERRLALIMYKSKELLRKAMENNLHLAELVSKSGLDVDEKKKRLTNLQEIMKTYCQVDNNLKSYEVCENELEKRRSQDDFQNNKNFNELLEDMSKKKTDATQHETYRKLEEKIRMSMDELDAELEIEATPNIICPVSKQVMVQPMTNKLCGHVYDKSSVYELLKMSKKGIRCPMPGCVKASRFKASDLEPNDALKRYISLQEKQKR